MPVASSLSNSELRPVAREFELAVHGDEPLALLARLFLLGSDIEAERLTALGLDVDGLVRAEVLAPSAGDPRLVSARVIVDRVGDVFAVGDRRDTSPDYVASVSGSTRLSAAFVPRVEVARALDVGCGSGALALVAAVAGARSVVATDVNPRALSYTRMNAELNGVAPAVVETRSGSYFEPVARETFGLVVVNPPYVIVSDGTSVYRDSGSGSDSLSRSLLAELPSFLDEGGWGVLQGNWIHRVDEPWHAPIGAGLAGSGCDALLVRSSTEDALSYAARWSEHQHIGDPDGYRDRVRALRRSYIDAGIERISGAVVVLRKRSAPPGGSNWRRALTLGALPVGFGERLPAFAAAQDRLESVGGDGLRDAVLRAVDGLDVVRSQRPGEAARCVLDLASAPSTRRPVPPEIADIVLRLDGETPLGALAGDVPVDQFAVLIKTGFVDFA